MIPGTLQVLFPTSVLRPTVDLLDPDNTETIWEYYLLENLACGLVRDSQSSVTGYDGCIAEQFYQKDERTWAFKIGHLKWSDGSDIVENEILNWLNGLTSTSKRHIQFLKLAEEIKYDSSSRTITMRFPFKVDQTILHELSLADASLLPSDYKTKGWAKTTGPYRVEKWDSSSKQLMLVANPNSRLFKEAMPKQVVLAQLQDVQDRDKIFQSIFFDVVPLNATTGPRRSRDILQRAPQVFEAFPTSIIFFHFNPQNKDAKALSNRLLFSSIIQRFRNRIEQLTEGASPFLPETQLIPDGFDGRLDTSPNIVTPSETTLTHVTVKLSPSFLDFEPLMQGLVDEFSRAGINLELKYSLSPDFDGTEFASIYNFIGNQQDSTGTWSFLADKEQGLLRGWFSAYQNCFRNVFAASDLINREHYLKQLHERILLDALAVPLMVGKQRYLLSKRIDSSRWNKFDARMRFYELRWK